MNVKILQILRDDMDKVESSNQLRREFNQKVRASLKPSENALIATVLQVLALLAGLAGAGVIVWLIAGMP
ncbi:MAG: hypothetical protein WC714_28835 [Candidatus Obscuribacterales bacterium]|jgi:hypothetical protein